MRAVGQWDTMDNRASKVLTVNGLAGNKAVPKVSHRGTRDTGRDSRRKTFGTHTLSLVLLGFLVVSCHFQAISQTTAPGAPGQDAQWLSAGKQAIGTSANPESKVWFTLANGVLTEVLYPNVQTANVQMLQFVVVNPKTKKVETEWDDANHQIKALRPDSLSFQQINTAKSGQWMITKGYTVDTENNSILINVLFETKEPALNLYVYYDPSISNSGMQDSAWTNGGILIAKDRDIVSALAAQPSFNRNVDNKIVATGLSVNGFAGVNDGLTQLRKGSLEVEGFQRAENGNVIQTAHISPTIWTERYRQSVVQVSGQPLQAFNIVLSFGPNEQAAISSAQLSLSKGFARILAEYEKGWSDFVRTLPKVDPKYQAQFNMAAMVVKALEDKATRGGNVASLSVPWGGGGNGNEGGTGYRMIWSRDLYHVFTAFLAIGDKAAAERALDFLFKIQQKEDGSFPQNSSLNGKEGWGSLQMDEVGYPLIMAWQIGKFDKETYEKHVKKAANFIVNRGPFSPQERWEERPGYSPSTIAAEIAGLVCAADIAKRNGDEASALIWLAAADDWARNVERWTATTKGKYGDGNYYLRISEKGEPDGNHKIELNNNAGTFSEHEIVDAGFLELVRLGIKRADDPLIVKSLKVIDQLIKIDTPSGPAFYRYNHDGYGEMDDGRKWNFDGKYTGKGRPWPLLSGERGQYELASHLEYLRDINTPRMCPNGRPCPRAKPSIHHLIAAKSRLDHMLAFASESLMLPEQIWDKKTAPPNADRRFMPELKFGKGTGSATPLAWSMGQFIRLATNLKAGRNLDTPQIVYDRYKNGIPSKLNNFGGLDEEVIIPLKPGVTVPTDRPAEPGTRIAYSLSGRTQITTAGSDGKAKTEFTMPTEPTVALVGVQAPDGATSFERIKILGAPPEQKYTPEMIEKIKASKTSPIVDGDSVVFFYRGKADMVQISGDMTGWSSGRIFMQKIGDDLFAYQTKLPPNARAEYKYTINGKWELDPLNAN